MNRVTCYFFAVWYLSALLLFSKTSYAQTDKVFVALVENKELGFHYIDSKGNVLIGKDKGNRHDFADGLLRKENKMYGFVNYKNEWVIPPAYVNASNFSDGFAPVEKNFEGWGYINKKGEWLVEPIYGAAHRFSDGMAAVRKGGTWGYINTEGKMVVNNTYSNVSLFNNGYAAVQKGVSAWILINKSGNTIAVFPSKFDFIGNYSNQRIRVRQTINSNVYWGYVDSAARQLIPSKFKNAYDFTEGLARVKEKDSWGYIDQSGNYVIPPLFDGAEEFINGVARVKLQGKWGVIDKTGKWIIDAKFDGLRDFSNGLAAAEKGLWGYIDISGNWVIQPSYKMAKDFVIVEK